MERNAIQKSIDQLSIEAVQRYLPKGMKLYPCDIHGHFLEHYKNTDPVCPLCIKTGAGEGTTATQVEHFIDLRDAIAPATNPHS